MAIDVGTEAINRPEYASSGYTFIVVENPANASGTITTVALYVLNAIANCEVGIFYNVSGTIFTSRSNAALPSYIAAGYSEHEVSLAVETGDYIGIYFSGGDLDRHDAGGNGAWYVSGDNIPCTDLEFTLSAGRTLSLYGTGESGDGAFIPTVTII